jgi:hypothetical protein
MKRIVYLHTRLYGETTTEMVSREIMPEILRKDTVNEAIIIYCGQKARVKCDRNCSKAWGQSTRLRRDPDTFHDNDFLPDDELGNAPQHPGTAEGCDLKPEHPDEFPNKWCVRECERCTMSAPGEWMHGLALRTF